jgi:VanZ family protein
MVTNAVERAELAENHNHRVRILPVYLALLATAIILHASLMPYDFRLDHAYAFLSGENSGAIELRDLLNNIVFYVPLGLALAWLFASRGRRKPRLALRTCLCGLVLSSSVEILQTCLPRSPSASDILMNVCGTLLGWLCFRLTRRAVGSKLDAFFSATQSSHSTSRLVLLVGAYLVLHVLLLFLLQSRCRIDNWDKEMPLLVGNERTGDRPWRGRIQYFSILKRALPQHEIADFARGKRLSGESLVAAFRFDGGESFPDETGNAPPLIWTPAPPERRDPSAARLTPDRWLATQSPAAFIAEELEETDELTLFASLATDDTAQTGPARIISISESGSRRNLTLGQGGEGGDDLIFRLRTPASGQNGSDPAFSFRDVFDGNGFLDLAITYKASVARLFVDGSLHGSIELSKGAALVSLGGQANIGDMTFYKLFYYGLVFGPLAIVLALLYQCRSASRVAYASTILAPLVLECHLMALCRREFVWGNVLLSVGIMVATMAFFKLSDLNRSGRQEEAAAPHDPWKP